MSNSDTREVYNYVVNQAMALESAAKKSGNSDSGDLMVLAKKLLRRPASWNSRADQRHIENGVLEANGRLWVRNFSWSRLISATIFPF